MMNKIKELPVLTYNAIPPQMKTAISALTVKEWNEIISVLSLQANITTRHIENLYQVLFGELESIDDRYTQFVEAYNSGLLQTLLDAWSQIQQMADIHIGPTEPTQEVTTLWIDTSEGD